MALKTNYEKWYESEGYFWGTEPAQLCYELIKLVPPAKGVKVLDLGCGEGKDGVRRNWQGGCPSAPARWACMSRADGNRRWRARWN